MSRKPNLAAGALVAAMAVGLVVMWVANPVFSLWLASQPTQSRQPSMGLYLLVFGGIVATMFAMGFALGALARLHGRLTGRGGRIRVQAAWLRSMRGERPDPRGTELNVLDVVMVASVTIALAAMAIWFLLFAGSSLPGA